ncbi:cation diffusion facilitator family transporter [Georgenia sp. EYE_87]|uniref:cation diffusion facilitator family transporter n=1 Tax=Georgenia sp. EYE_87 TaxID=2853448 RepID=UPI002003E883|nr:cation diffusion facilitator family transporter [Georgenia sp. EYE_87]MCK6211211.1 cation diffusion facilitator family transporter [Georgenia sp. EYE_87]
MSAVRHQHGHDDGHGHDDPHAHGHHDDHAHQHDHDHHHHGGLRGFLQHLFVPHSHDAADSIDDALEASAQGIRAVKFSLVALGVTAALQLVIVAVSGSVALAADTVHNFSDALTAVPLWIAFVLGRRAPTRRFTHGLGRAEDLAGLFIVAMIALSAVVAAVESVRRLVDPVQLDHLGWVLAAGIIGFAGNEAVAVYRIRVGRRIGSAALVADGVHARTDGFTSLAVVAGVIGVWLGFPQADPVVGLIISAMIGVLLWGTARDVGRRLLDGVDPDLTDRAEEALRAVPGVGDVADLRLRWNGHRLDVTAAVALAAETTVGDFVAVQDRAARALRRALPGVGTVAVSPVPDRARSGHAEPAATGPAAPEPAGTRTFAD